MRVVVDSSVLMYLIDPEAPAPIDPQSGRPVEHCTERLEGLLESLSRDDVEVIVPTPVLSELLIQADSGAGEILQVLRGKKSVRIDAFDTLAAIENAFLRRTNAQRHGATKAQVTFDLQIMAIARVHQAAVVYTDDGNLRGRCERSGIQTRGIADLPVPEGLMQRPLQLENEPVQEHRDERLPEPRLSRTIEGEAAL